MSMATVPDSVTVPLHQPNPTRFSTRTRHARKLKLTLSQNSPLQQSCTFPPISLPTTTKFRRLKNISSSVPRAYVTGPPIVSESDPRVYESQPDTDKAEPPDLISRKLLLSLLVQHRLGISVLVLALIGCTTCTLSMPIFSGQFFEVLIGARPEPLWKLLSKAGLLYSLEPIFTVIFLTNMNTIWEKVMSTLRAQIFRRVLIQKVGEHSGLLTSDLGSLKDVVSENISRDRGFRALSEANHSILKQKLLGQFAYCFPIPPTSPNSGPLGAFCVRFNW
ncbi:hypothetical protein REPUB_Repub07fG0126000 [Reevesia pubescens]